MLVVVALLVALALLVLHWLGTGGLGHDWMPGPPSEAAVAPDRIAERTADRRSAALSIGVPRPKQVLFGDLHVHSTFSLDAFMMALPTGGGEGAHPVNDACDYARHCAGLDFWSINDHALAMTPRNWSATIDAIRACNEVASDPANPDTVAYLGWEWTQMGNTPKNHYGHKNVVVKGLSDDEIPTRPISARPPDSARDLQRDQQPSSIKMGLFPLINPGQDTHDLVRYFAEVGSPDDCPDGVPERELPTDCRESAPDPATLFSKLDDWGFESMVIPHGTTWGFYTPQGSAWDKQLVGAQHDPERQRLIEIYSGHGNSEEFRSFREVAFDDDGEAYCPEPTADFLPSCWRAGEIIAERCAAAGLADDECRSHAEEARRLYVDGNIMGHLTVPGVEARDWLDSGQCTDCFQPAFNYRPRSSAQYIMAIRNFDEDGQPRRFHFGFMASSDNHLARPGTGFKEKDRIGVTEARLSEAGSRFMGRAMPMEELPPEPRSVPFAFDRGGSFFDLREGERASAFFVTGGLVAVHSEGRSREAIWDALERREVYGTSGPRILLWFDLLNPPGSTGRVLPMGGETRLDETPIFQVRAVGSFVQAPGCDDSTVDALGADRVANVCRGECYRPTDERRLITRIEVVRIRPQSRPGEPVEGLVEDVWKSFACSSDPAGCAVTFTDPEFQTAGRDTVYYVRAIEEEIPAINADALVCTRDAEGRCIETAMCIDSQTDRSDDCLAPTEQRAWSSPIFVGYGT